MTMYHPSDLQGCIGLFWVLFSVKLEAFVILFWVCCTEVWCGDGARWGKSGEVG